MNLTDEVTKSDQEKQGVSAPAITLPKGGGAIHGIGEKFSANPVTGTGSMSIPIATSPGRAGFAPQLSISYDSGAGNGIFGLGWNLGLPSISRKTDKGLPRYLDQEASDVFLLSGVEDLVPSLTHQIQNNVSLDNKRYQVSRYQPRIEGSFALIEKWVNETDNIDCFWRTISRDNITSWFGRSELSRIFDPSNHSHIFQWLLDETRDDKGNIIQYFYQAEDAANVSAFHLHEFNRLPSQRTANRYLKRILYGNTVSYLDEANWGANKWMFEVVFDYSDHSDTSPVPNPNSPWHLRGDSFSTYRAGFEIRTYRLCQRVLMYHHFTELGDQPYLIKSTDFTYHLATDLNNPVSPGYTQLTEITHRSYERDEKGDYQSRQHPPITFNYSQPKIDDTLQSIEASQLENLPVGVQGQGYQWVDLDGEGLSGILSEQGDDWYYKPNHGGGNFGGSRVVASMPAMAALSSGRQQLMDLAGDGEIDLVDFSAPTPGFHERTIDYSWKRFVPFASLPNIDWNDPNLRFLDLTGDGHADAVITEQDVFTWYSSLEEKGFDQAQYIRQSKDEDTGARLVFADGTQTIFLADMCGDGLTDLVRIRNGEVCYWSNLGYGRFARKITLDNSPIFDHPDMYDPRRIRLADIDGSGPTDIIYLGRDGARLYFNRSGNSLSNPVTVNLPVATENLAAVQVADLLGNGTACLVWNSHLPADTSHPVRYINLMAEGKPHLLIGTDNNLGLTTKIDYTPSTHFYIQDKLVGTPWITRLPFPVHCVSKVTVTDKWRNATFSTTYSYHHGYFDGIEREFRGFGRVEQVDIEDYGTFAKSNSASPYITDDYNLYQPPIKTITWYHTGAALDRHRILTQFTHEYIKTSFTEKPLPEPQLDADLSADEWREALRACKGIVLRQESYELDVEALNSEIPKHVPVRIYSAATHNCQIKCLQRKANNQHAVFLITESEAITYNYELDLRIAELSSDPRIVHTLNLRFDDYARPIQTVSVVYPRQLSFSDSIALDTKQLELINKVQKERHIAYTETHYTAELPYDPNQHRLPAPCEVLTYELTGDDSKDGFVTTSKNIYFSLDDFSTFKLSDTLSDQGTKPVTNLNYHEQPTNNKAHKRLVEWVRMLYFKDDLSDKQPFGQYAWLGLPYETYKLALTTELLNEVFQDKLDWEIDGNQKKVLEHFNEPIAQNSPYLKSGYILGSGIDPTLHDQYWIRSGTAGFTSDAKDHFYQPDKYIDPFGNKTKLKYDDRDLFILTSEDALGNITRINKFDYRVLSPSEMVDANDNYTEVVFDILGLPVAAAVKGKKMPNNQWEGDDLKGFDFASRNPPPQDIQNFCTNTVMNDTIAKNWLGRATTRFIYHFGDKNNQWSQHLAGACSITREQHKDLSSKLQVSLECSDGSGNVLMKKIQAEPEQENGSLRWIINGLTILNNKGKPVKQYEPSFSKKGFGCEMPPKEGVTPIIYYDAAGRTIRTEMPDGTVSRVEFSPWHVKTFDANDTAFDPSQQNHSDWYQRRTDPNHPRFAEFHTTENTRAAELVKIHANTPAITILDSLGRDVIAIAHNRIEDANGTYKVDTKKYRDEYYTTYTKLDAEGKPLWIRDALNHLVMQYITPPKANNDLNNTLPPNAVPAYDIAGNQLFQHSMDAGDRWTINDAAGKPLFAWDVYKANDTAIEEKRLYSTQYDALHRPTELWLKINDNPSIMVERYEYQDAQANNNNNLNGQLVKHYDPSGLITTIALDFKGSPLEVHRRLVLEKTSTVTDWQGDSSSLAQQLSDENFVQITEYDALKRMTRLYNWHRGVGRNVAIYEPQYSERGTLKSEMLLVKATRNAATTGKRYDTDANTQTNIAIEEIRYDAKGQRQYLKLGNGVITTYTYDTETFRLINLRTSREKTETCSAGFSSAFVDSHIIQDLHYCYDPVGNITEIRDAAFKDIFYQNQKVEPNNRYQYDALYRLSSATGRENGALTGAPQNIEPTPLENQFPCVADNAFRNYTQTYQYDPVGNIQQMRHEAGSQGSWTRRYQYAFDDSHQAVSNRLWRTWQGDKAWDGSKANNSVTYAYDSHGSMLNLADTPDDYHLQWDYRDMIAAINLGNGSAYYQYDAGKQRTRKWIDRNVTNTNGNTQNIKEERVYLGGVELYRRWVNDVLTEEIETLHLFDGEQRLLMVDQITKTDDRLGERNLYRYILSNHLGSATLELDEKADIISYEEYHPYGTTAYRAGRNAAEVKLKRYRYTGMEQDEESGLSYHSARYYLPWLGRWLSADPILVQGGLNVYVYSSGTPTMLKDMGGKAPKKPLPKVNEEVTYGIAQLNPNQAVTDQVPLGKGKGSTRPDNEIVRKLKNNVEEGAGKTRIFLEDKLRSLKNPSRMGSQEGKLRDVGEMLEQGIKNIQNAGKKGMKVTKNNILVTIAQNMPLEEIKSLQGELKSILGKLKAAKANIVPKETLDKINIFVTTLSEKKQALQAAKNRIIGQITAKNLIDLAESKQAQSAVKHLKNIGKQGSKVLGIGLVLKVLGVGSTAYAAGEAVSAINQGDKAKAISKGAEVGLDVAETLPVSGQVIGAGRTGYAVGEMMNDFLVDEDLAMSQGQAAKDLMSKLGAGEGVSDFVGGAAASLSAVTQALTGSGLVSKLLR